MTENAVPRRSVVALAGVGLAMPLLAACAAASSEVASDPNAAPATKSTKKGSKAAHSGTQLAATSDIPVGGAALFSSQAVVVTQPTAGEFKCFSSVCTHAGCSVAAGSTLVCPCHGSEFSITDGSVLMGPASVPLPAKKIAVAGGEIFLES